MRGRRLTLPLVLGLALLAALVALLFLPEFVPLRHPQIAHVSALVNGVVTGPPFEPGQAGFRLGTDVVGRDRLSRLVYGARYTLGIGAFILVARILVAVPLRLWAGWRGGWAGRLSLVLGSAFSALPTLVLIGMVLRQARGLIFANSAWFLVYCGTVAVVGAPRLMEHVRHRTREIALLPHIEAATAVGAGESRILRRHVLPLISSDLLVTLSAEMAWVLLLMGQLAVFGIYVGGSAVLADDFGVISVSEYWPEWGMMMGASRSAILLRAWLPLMPAAALGLSAACFHLLAEGFRLRSVR